MSWKKKTADPKKPVLANFAKNEMIFREGEVGSEGYLIKSGSVEIIKFDGVEYQSLANLESPTLFGEMALIDRQPRSASARAKEDTTLEVLDQPRFLEYLRKEPSAAWNLMTVLSSNLRKANERFSVDALSDSKDEETEDSIQEENKGLLDKTKEDLVAKYSGLLRYYENRSLPTSVLNVTFGSFILFLLTVIWLTVSSVDTTVLLTGKITTASPNIEVQSNFSSVVQEVYAARGQLVKEGAPLIKFDDTLLSADSRKLNLDKTFAEAELSRFEQALGIPVGTSNADVISDKTQRQIFLNQREEFISKMAAFQANEKGLESEIEIQLELESGRQKLYEKELLSKVELLTTRTQRLNAERQLASIRADKNAFSSEWIATANEKYSLAKKNLLVIEEELEKIKRQKEDVLLLSPITGLVLNIDNIFPGAVVSSGTTVLTLVPVDDQLLAEFTVSSVDAGLLSTGANVMISLDALPYQKHGQIDASLIYISADVTEDIQGDTAQSSFTVLSDLDIGQLKSIPESFIATPGMSLVGRVKVGERRLIAYLLYPVIKTLDQSFTEP